MRLNSARSRIPQSRQPQKNGVFHIFWPGVLQAKRCLGFAPESGRTRKENLQPKMAKLPSSNLKFQPEDTENLHPKCPQKSPINWPQNGTQAKTVQNWPKSLKSSMWKTREIWRTCEDLNVENFKNDRKITVWWPKRLLGQLDNDLHSIFTASSQVLHRGMNARILKTSALLSRNVVLLKRQFSTTFEIPIHVRGREQGAKIGDAG